ncbi:hypothetical protein BJY00DRAFT_226854 [Aspergillus carlsbadensis]|nr:hypothetical protein BJY00DRAFT_226854 [Aspergillus carlsbadensis]
MEAEMAHKDSRFQEPEYPPDEALVSRRVSLKPLDAANAQPAHPSQSLGTSLWDNPPIRASANIWHGSAEYGREITQRDTLLISLPIIWSGKGRRGKGDRNNFNLWNRRGQVSLHLSFRRGDQTVRINAWSASSVWGDEQYIEFPQVIRDERSFDLGIKYDGEGSFGLHFGEESVSLDVDAYEPPDSFTYRVSDDGDAMFGESVDTAMYY